jgi:CheY-like chemotaxis protein
LKVYVVDDEPLFADEIAATAREFGEDVAVHHEVESAWRELEGEERMDVLVFLDHDFHGEAKGYQLCSQIRRHHPLGLLLPIIYLTGRETGEGYTRHWADEPVLSPSLYLDKGALTRQPTLLQHIIERFGVQFEQMLDLADEQAARRALITFRTTEEEPLLDE